MRSIALQSFLFLALMTAFYIINVGVLNRFYLSGKRLACWVNPQFAAVGGQDLQITRDWKSDAKYDIVVGGSSHAYRGYDPRIFEKFDLNLYTIGTGYQNPMATYLLLKNDCQLKPGTLLIIDLYDNTFSGDGMGCFSRLIPNAASETTAREFVWRKPDLRLINAYFCYLATDQNTIESQLKEGYIRNGYSSDSDSSMQALDTTSVAASDASFNVEYLDYLQRIVDLAAAQSCRVIFATHPAPHSPRNMQFHNAFRAYLDPFLDRNKLTYLDFSVRPEFDPAFHFMDSNHLNQAGVDKYNKLLLDSLKSLHILNIP